MQESKARSLSYLLDRVLAKLLLLSLAIVPPPLQGVHCSLLESAQAAFSQEKGKSLVTKGVMWGGHDIYFFVLKELDCQLCLIYDLSLHFILAVLPQHCFWCSCELMGLLMKTQSQWAVVQWLSVSEKSGLQKNYSEHLLHHWLLPWWLISSIICLNVKQTPESCSAMHCFSSQTHTKYWDHY